MVSGAGRYCHLTTAIDVSNPRFLMDGETSLVGRYASGFRLADRPFVSNDPVMT